MSWAISLLALIAAHIPTAVYCCQGYANDTVPPQAAAPYVSWATTSKEGAAADRAAGIEHTVQYLDASRVYVGDHAYSLVNGGPYAGARALTCAGQVVQTTSPAGYLIDPFKPETARLLEEELNYAYDPSYTAYFMDDVDAFRWGIANGTPCAGNTPWTEPATAQAYAALLGRLQITGAAGAITPRIIINGLSEYADKPGAHVVPLYALAARNVIGGMCEGCFADNSPNALKSGAEWQDDLDLEIRTVRMHKIFWDYVRYGPNDAHARLYTFASFMLAWNPDYTIYQTAYKTDSPGQLHVTPETGLVAHDPTRRPSNARELQDPDGTFVREYKSCYYRREPIGPCAFVVNSDAVPHRRPRLEHEFGHTVEVHGGMVLEGGTISLRGPKVPDEIPPQTGQVLTR